MFIFIKYIDCRQSMISRAAKNHQRLPLGQIPLPLNQTSTNSKTNKDVKNIPLEASLNQSEVNRLKQLKSKYTKSITIENNENTSSTPNNHIVDTSFKSIHLQTLAINQKNSHTKSFNEEQKQFSSAQLKSRISFSYHNFESKIQQSSLRIESNIDRVQDKLKILKQSYQKRQPSFNESSQPSESHHKHYSQVFYTNIKSNIGPLIVQNSQSLTFNLKKLSQTKKDGSNCKTKTGSNCKTKTDQKIEQLPSKQSYAQQMKSINFIDEIKRKIEEIGKETKTNLQKKASQISRASKIITNKQNQPHSLQDNQQKMTLANMTPNLAQSEVVQTTQRERFSERNLVQSKSPVQSLVVQNYIFQSNNQSSYPKYNFGDKIMQDPEVDDMLQRASPSISKSPFGETNLEETHMIQRNQLQGDMDTVQQEIQGEFVLLINRLAYQAEIDNRFSSEIFKYDNIFVQKQSLKSIIASRIKQYYLRDGLPFDQKMFQVGQMELDPLAVIEKVHKDCKQEQIIKAGFSLNKLYEKNCYYFEKKLFHCFSQKTIRFLIDELQKCHSLKSGEQLSVGHLTSYVNMRTGKNLRNRYFYRILKRIVPNNHKIGSNFRKQDLFSAFARK